jgi:hypothetical protein
VIDFRTCPRCEGTVLVTRPQGRFDTVIDDPSCINCGWRRTVVPPDVLTEVRARMGKAYMESRYFRNEIGKGKVPLSGWERSKQRRERERMHKSGATGIAAPA